MVENHETLGEQIEKRRREISSDWLAMSIGELTSMYQSNELIIRPEFQRFFRWDDGQKSRLIEKYPPRHSASIHLRFYDRIWYVGDC